MTMAKDKSPKNVGMFSTLNMCSLWTTNLFLTVAVCSGNDVVTNASGYFIVGSLPRWCSTSGLLLTNLTALYLL